MSDIPSSSAPVSSSPSTPSSPQPSSGGKDVSSSSPTSSQSSTSSGSVPSVESVTGGAVKPEQSSKESSGNTAPAEKIEQKVEEARIRAKVNGKEREYTMEEARRRLELIDGAEEKFQSAAQMRKQVEQFIETLRKDPKKILLNPDLGINFREIAEEYLGGEVRKEMMDPQQRELEELRGWKADQERMKQEAADNDRTQTEQKQYEAAKLSKLKEYDQKIAKVLSEAQLPKTPYTVKRVAEVLHSAKKKGYELDLATAVDFVREGYLSDLQAMTGGLEGDQLLNLLGGDIAKRIRKHDLAKIRAKVQPEAAMIQEQSQQASPTRSAPKQDKYLTQAEWIDAARKKAGF